MNYENRDSNTTTIYLEEGCVNVNPIELFINMIENVNDKNELDVIMKNVMNVVKQTKKSL